MSFQIFGHFRAESNFINDYKSKQDAPRSVKSLLKLS
jgi:hypothetical protein